MRRITPSILYIYMVALITNTNPTGTTNSAPIGSVRCLGERCTLDMLAASQTTVNFLRTGECVISLLDVSASPAIKRLHGATGSSIVPNLELKLGDCFLVDGQLDLLGSTPLECFLVAPPRLVKCPLAMKATLVTSHGILEDEQLTEGLTVSLELKVVRSHADPRIRLLEVSTATQTASTRESGGQ